MKGLDALKKGLFSTIGIGMGLSILASIVLLTNYASATTITADHLEYIKEELKYMATGNVRIVKDTAVIQADEAVYFSETGDALLSGHVTIDDKDYLINTEEAEFNLNDKTGTLHNAVIFFKAYKYWISGLNMQKLGENHYYAKTAYLTTCDSEEYRTAKVITSATIPFSQRPDWCFKGDDADIVVGDKMTASNMTYRVKDLPVLYSPYFSTPVGEGRTTGFLLPAVGNSTTKGVRFSPSFYWAIDENKDATFTADYFSKRGVGEGAQYRFVDLNQEGTWYAYHIRDNELHKDFVEVTGTEKYSAGNVKAFLDVHYVNDNIFPQEYPKDFLSSISRFEQSTGEISESLDNSRLYLLSQYWINMQVGLSEHPAQKAPEIGYVVNPTAVGPAIFTFSANAANFYRIQEPQGQRIDLQPALSYSFGDTVRLTQTMSVRETAYNLTEGDTSGFGSMPHREMFQYDAQAQTRLLKDYGSFQHIVEPSVEVTFIPSAKLLPLFDVTELPAKTALGQFSLFNKFVFKAMDVSLRLTQAYDLNSDYSHELVDNFNAIAQGITANGITQPPSFPQGSAHHLQPTRLEGTVGGAALPVNFNLDVTGDNRLSNLNSAFSFKVFKDIALALGERYSQVDNLRLVTLEINAPIDKHWTLATSTWYDATGPGLQNLTVRTIYKEQCWDLNLVVTKRPATAVVSGSWSYLLLLELKGMGELKL
ncbi:MAG: LPS-assembly protein LptD [Dissulfurispiraceae bacterium]